MINSIDTTKSIIDALTKPVEKPKNQLNELLNPSSDITTELLNAPSVNDLVKIDQDYKLTISQQALSKYENLKSTDSNTFLDSYTKAAKDYESRYEETKDSSYLESAINMYKKAIDYNKADENTTYNSIANDYEKLGDLDSAKTYYSKILENDENNVDANANMLRISLETNDTESADLYANKLESLDYLNNNAKNQLGSYYLANDNTDKAREYFYDVVSSDKENIDGIVGLSKVNMKEGNYDIARQYLVAAIQIEPDNQTVLDAFEELNSVS